MRQEVQTFVSEYVRNERLALNVAEVESLIDDLVDEMVGSVRWSRFSRIRRSATF